MRGQNTSSTSISVSWEEVQAELQNGIITGYTIKYQSLTENDNGVVQAGRNDRQANLTGLKQFVEYNISVVAFTVKGGGPPNFTVVRTDQDSKSYKTCFSLLLLQSVLAFLFLFFSFCGEEGGQYSDAQADVMISSIDVYLLTLSAFLSMIVAVVVAM